MSDEKVDYRIDPVRLMENLRKTPDQRLAEAKEAAKKLYELTEFLRTDRKWLEQLHKEMLARQELVARGEKPAGE